MRYIAFHIPTRLILNLLDYLHQRFQTPCSFVRVCVCVCVCLSDASTCLFGSFDWRHTVNCYVWCIQSIFAVTTWISQCIENTFNFMPSSLKEHRDIWPLAVKHVMGMIILFYMHDVNDVGINSPVGWFLIYVQNCIKTNKQKQQKQNKTIC